MIPNDPHYARHCAILKVHPEIKKLFGTDLTTAFYGLVVMLAHVTMCLLVQQFGGWQFAVASGICVGAFLDLAIMVFLHECSHHLIFRTPIYNVIMGIVANVPLILPISIVFNQHHKQHHIFLGDGTNDVDVPLSYETELVGNSTAKKLVWLLFSGFILAARSTHKLGVILDRYLVVNWSTCIGTGLVLLYFAPKVALYLVVSAFCSLSFHPANARIVQRHCPPQSEALGHRSIQSLTNTYSYYGWSNILLLNVGYHVEHHDFPRVPWLLLPKIKQIAPEFYTDPAHESRGFWDMVKFVTDSGTSLALYTPPPRAAADGAVSAAKHA